MCRCQFDWAEAEEYLWSSHWMCPSLNISSADADAVCVTNTQVDIIIPLKQAYGLLQKTFLQQLTNSAIHKNTFHYHPFICWQGEGDITRSRSTELKLHILLNFCEGQEVTEWIGRRIAAFWISQASLCNPAAFWSELWGSQMRSKEKLICPRQLPLPHSSWLTWLDYDFSQFCNRYVFWGFFLCF